MYLIIVFFVLSYFYDGRFNNGVLGEERRVLVGFNWLNKIKLVVFFKMFDFVEESSKVFFKFNGFEVR